MTEGFVKQSLLDPSSVGTDIVRVLILMKSQYALNRRNRESFKFTAILVNRKLRATQSRSQTVASGTLETAYLFLKESYSQNC